MDLVQSVLSNLRRKQEELSRSQPVRQIRNVGNQLVGDTNPNQAGRQNFFTNTASNLTNSFRQPQKPYVSPLPKPKQIKLQQPQGNVIQNFFDPNAAGQGSNFWNSPIAKGLGAIQKWQESPPMIELSKYSENIQNPVGKVTADLGLGMVESLVNLPQRIAIGGNKLGTNIRTGEIKDPMVALNTAASVASPLLDIATLGGGTIVKGVGKQALKQVGTQGLKRTIAKGAVEGAGYGSLFGGLQGLSEGDRADIVKGIQGMATGGAFGALFGGGAAGIGGVLGKVFTTYKNLGLSDDVAKKETVDFFKRGGQTRDSRGRFAKTKQVKPTTSQKEAWAKVNEVLGRPLDTPVFPSDMDTAINRQLGIGDDFSIPQMGLSIKEVDSSKLVEPKIEVKNGKVQVKMEDVNAGLSDTPVYRGTFDKTPEADLARQRKSTIGISTVRDRSKAWAEDGRTVNEYLLDKSAKILEWDAIPANVRKQANDVNLKTDGDGWEEVIVPYAKKMGFDAVDSPSELKVINTSLLKKNPRVSQPSNISTDAKLGKDGKIRLSNMPTEVEIKNRAELNYGNPDLYDQRKVKLNKAFGNTEPLPWEANNLKGAQEYQNTQQSTSRVRIKEQQSSKIPTAGRTSNSLQTMQRSQQVSRLRDQTIGNSFEDIVDKSSINVNEKVGLLDYLRTPDRVLKKIGLEKEAKEIRVSYDNYLKELPQEINKITEWSKRVSPDANQRIFKYLDGQNVKLQGEELKVAKEIRSYLKDWADRLGLPEDNRIASYITHIFDEDFIQKEFDPDIAKLIRDKVAGSVYDPFLEKRLGKLGYVEDTWRALDAYVKRATRKANMDPILNKVKGKAEKLEESQYDYVKNYIDRINLRPTNADNLVDNQVKQLIGYRLGQRPVASLSRNIRRAVYRGTLGLNIGSALRNLTQGANTYATLGEKYTIIGYSKLAKALATGSDELERVGVLRNDLIEDRTLNATRKFWENLDKGLFVFFETAERINRGAAYFGAKSKFLKKNKNATEEQAIEFAKDIVRKTQFTFGSVDTPVGMQSDLVKLLTQFQSFNVKQTEFLGEMAKRKDLVGFVRFGLANTVALLTIGKLIGLDIKDVIPFGSVLTGESKLGQTPAIELAKEVGGGILGTEDEYGNKISLKDRALRIADKAGPVILPAYSQVKKTLQGIDAAAQGYSETAGGGIRYPINPTTGNMIRAGLFGQYNFPEAREFFDKDRRPIYDAKAEAFKETPIDQRQELYNSIMDKRAEDKNENEIKDALKAGQDIDNSGTKIRWLDENGEVQTVDLAETSHSTNKKGIEKFDKDNSNSPAAKARKIYQAPEDQLSKAEKEAAYKQLGFTPEDVRYDFMSSDKFSNEERVDYIISQNLTEEQLFERLLTGRRESVSGNMFIRDGVIDDLEDLGYITDAEAKYLKTIKYDKDMKLKPSKGRGKKVKVPKFIPLGSTKVKMTDAGDFDIPRSVQAPEIPIQNITFNTPFSQGGGIPQMPKFKVKFDL